MGHRVVIVGSGGRFGKALERHWRSAGDQVVGFNHAQLDLADDAAIERALEPLDFDVLVNCAALTNVDRCETHPHEAMRINAEAVRTLARICSAKARRCIHLSTDYVFDGNKRIPYSESDQPNPISHYGLSKRAGEEALLEEDARHLVVRVSWVFGPDRPSFVDAILARALENESVEAISDKVATPTFTEEASALLRPFLSQIPEGGYVHLSNTGECTWQEYGQHALDCAVAAGVPLKGRTVAPLKMADLKAFIARRPVYTAMATEKLSGLTGVTPRPWQVAVEEYVRGYWAVR